MDTQYGFTVGDYVIADGALFDDFTGQTFEVVGFSRSINGQPLVRVRNIKNDRNLVFYPGELSFEDGSRP